MKHSNVQYQLLASLAKSNIWLDALKPELLVMLRESTLSESDADNLYLAAQRDIKRSNTIKIINDIISTVEKAEFKIKGFEDK